ncbi:MAG: methylmalonyl Co-A mutase-associated GTPase MeaB [Crocinitomicaceae bacterium]|nr:methylmalonyl Co-A mutase-associated GTPase MeaB [Crocinitomicaceae bacterium]MDG1777457.1 methylmalonyl Co-A mutase-associated GTPase MeaB [Crocinitomicaceae bacterium]
MEPKNIKDWINKKKDQRKRLTPETLFDGIVQGDLSALSSGITLVESHNDSQRYAADVLIQKCLPHSGRSIRVGITGVPGVGKSTFIESFGMLLIARGFKVAVLAVDPSSSVSGGSILGDKTRMNELSVQDSVFIRPSPAGDTLGGVARKTRESILLCEAAGYDFILVETVGVGQSETVVKSMVDFFLLLMLSGAGDELQGIKKGIMEMADALVITKADGDNKLRAKLAARAYKNALHLFPANKNNWIPTVSTCSALEKSNIANILDVIEDFRSHVVANGTFVSNRKEQDKNWLSETLKELIVNDFFLDGQMILHLKEVEQKMINGEMTSFQAADELYKYYTNARRI